MLAASLLPLYILAALVLLVLLLAVFVWLGGGRFAVALLASAVRIPAVRRFATRSYLRELEKTNPLAARAYAKVEHVSGKGSERHAERALAVLSPAERRAYLELFNEAGGSKPRRHRGREKKRVRHGGH